MCPLIINQLRYIFRYGIHTHIPFCHQPTCLFTKISILLDFPAPVLITTSLHYSSLHSHQKQVILFSLEQLFLTQLIPYEISVTSALSDVVSISLFFRVFTISFLTKICVLRLSTILSGSSAFFSGGFLGHHELS